MGLFGVDVSLFKDEGARKLIATITAMLCVTAIGIVAMVLTKTVDGILVPLLNIDATLLGLFVGGNVIEGIKKTIGDVKIAKAGNGGTTPPQA